MLVHSHVTGGKSPPSHFLHLYFSSFFYFARCFQIYVLFFPQSLYEVLFGSRFHMFQLFLAFYSFTSSNWLLLHLHFYFIFGHLTLCSQICVFLLFQSLCEVLWFLLPYVVIIFGFLDFSHFLINHLHFCNNCFCFHLCNVIFLVIVLFNSCGCIIRLQICFIVFHIY